MDASCETRDQQEMSPAPSSDDVAPIDLDTSRARIDEIDRTIVNLFQQRMCISRDVADYKRATGKPVFDREREEEKVLSAIDMADDEFKQFMAPLFNMVMEMSRAYQASLLSSKFDGNGTPLELPHYDSLPAGAHVVCQGVAGSYQHIACNTIFQAPAVSFVDTWTEVCDAIAAGTVDFGMLPLENSTAGTVDRVYDLLSKRGLTIVAAITLRINHDLCVKPGVELSDVREIISHDQALRQCERFIDGLPGDVRSISCRNTAMAAQAVSESDRRDIAAIASSAAAELYGLSVIAHGIQDESQNFTRFICLAKQPALYGDAHRTSFLVTLPHEPGSLFRVLSRIAALGVNMLKLESRPIPGREFEFMFYIDIESVPGDKEFAQVISQIQPLCDSICYLGSYSETSR